MITSFSMHTILHASLRRIIYTYKSLYILASNFASLSFSQVHEPTIPADLLQTQPSSGLEFTSLCYGAHPTLFIGTNNGIHNIIQFLHVIFMIFHPFSLSNSLGLVTIWDTTENKCLLYWRTEPSEISMSHCKAHVTVQCYIGYRMRL